MNRKDVRRVLVGVGVGTLAAAALVVEAGPAAAAVPGLVRVTATSATSSADSRTITATCPATSPTLLSAGYELNGALGDVVVDDLQLHAGSVTVVAYEADPYLPNWTLTAYAICADPPPNLVRLTAAGASSSSDFKSLVLDCGTDALLGAGFALGNATGEAVVDDLRPSGTPLLAPVTATFDAYEADPDYLPNWNVSAYATCADPLPGLVRRSATSALNDSSDFKNVTASCEAGEVLVGSGYETNGGGGEVVVDDYRPNGNATTAPTAVTVGAYEEDATNNNWTIGAYAICATA